MGLLSKGDVLLKNPSDFVGGALGSSERRTRDILQAAQGGVLVIDEAYSLYSGSDGGRNDPYKAAVVDTIVEQVRRTCWPSFGTPDWAGMLRADPHVAAVVGSGHFSSCSGHPSSTISGVCELKILVSEENVNETRPSFYVETRSSIVQIRGPMKTRGPIEDNTANARPTFSA
jgi:hypothetical protein